MDWDGTNTTTDVYGCTNSTATNYNSEATIDDGSCEYEEEPVYDCTNSTATNYNSEATVDDGSCEYEEEPDTDVKTEGDFYFIPAEGETLTANLAIQYGFIVNRVMHPESVSLLDLFTPPLQPKLCLRMGSNQEMAFMDYLNENQLFVSLNSLNIEDFNIGQSNFMSQQCTVWMAPYDKLVDFNNSHPVEFERMILSETLAIVSTESKQIPVMAQYDDYPGFKTNREKVAVRTWILNSQTSSIITINSADLWWIDIEGNDDSCEWIFEIYINGNIMDNATSSCTTDGSQLINSTYNINITFEVIEGDIIEIQVWYEGWDNIEFYYGSEMYPSGFYISGLELPELISGCTNTTANNYDSEATEDDGSCLFDIMDDGTSLTDIGDDEVSFSFPDNSFLYGLVTLTVGALIAAGAAEMGARNSIPQIVEGLQQLIDSGITDSEINDALISLEDVDGLSYFSEDRTNALNLLTNYETMTGGALDSMAQLDELQSIVSELEASGISSPELEAEISEIESMISEQLEGDTNKDYSNTILDSFKNKEGGN
jgi:hypothetical protein